MEKKKKTKLKTVAKIRQAKPKAKRDGYHHGDLRATLIAAAFKILESKKPEELSLRELARKAGVSQAAPYRHFKDKEALFAAISKEGFDLKLQYMKTAVEKHRDNPREMYFQCGIAYFRMGLNHPEHFNLTCGAGGVRPDENHPELMMAASATFAVLRDMIKTCQKAKIIGAGDPYQISLHCWSMVHGFTVLYANDGLEWMGLTKDNTEKALRIFLGQFLTGAKEKLSTEGLHFNLFGTELSAKKKALLEQINSDSN